MNHKGFSIHSLKDHTHPHNDFKKLKKSLKVQWQIGKSRFIENAHKTLVKLKDEHEQFLLDEIEERKSTYSEIVSDNEWNRHDELTKDSEELKKCYHFFRMMNFHLHLKKIETAFYKMQPLHHMKHANY